LNCHTTDFLGIGNWELGMSHLLYKYYKYQQLLSTQFKFPKNRLLSLVEALFDGELAESVPVEGAQCEL
jgi:hypothetical protein